ncbi:MAG: hypothetical protein GY816_20035 [Cytophagales bacterium]|nr:hypothetical protein [Cytophagales bacterium]
MADTIDLVLVLQNIPKGGAGKRKTYNHKVHPGSNSPLKEMKCCINYGLDGLTDFGLCLGAALYGAIVFQTRGNREACNLKRRKNELRQKAREFYQAANLAAGILSWEEVDTLCDIPQLAQYSVTVLDLHGNKHWRI